MVARPGRGSSRPGPSGGRRERRRPPPARPRAGRVGMTMFNWRFSRALQRMHALIARGFLGRLWHVEAHWLGARWVDPAASPTWRMDRTQAGTGVLGDQGVHVADFVLWNFGRV